MLYAYAYRYFINFIGFSTEAHITLFGPQQCYLVVVLFNRCCQTNGYFKTVFSEILCGLKEGFQRELGKFVSCVNDSRNETWNQNWCTVVPRCMDLGDLGRVSVERSVPSTIYAKHAIRRFVVVKYLRDTSVRNVRASCQGDLCMKHTAANVSARWANKTQLF